MAGEGCLLTVLPFVSAVLFSTQLPTTFPSNLESATNGHANLALQQQGRGQQHHVAKGQPAPRIPGLTVLIFGGLVLGNINGFLSIPSMEILLWSLGRSLVRIETLGTAR